MNDPKMNAKDLAEVVDKVSQNLQKQWEDRERLKESIVEEIQKSSAQGWYKWLKHPLIITLVGVLASAGLGTLLSMKIESSIAKQTRNELLDQRLLTSRMELSEEVFGSLNDLNYGINKVQLCHMGVGEVDSLKEKSLEIFQVANASWMKKKDMFRTRAMSTYENSQEVISAIEDIDSVLYRTNGDLKPLDLYVRILAHEPKNQNAIDGLVHRFKEFKKQKNQLIGRINSEINALPER